MTEEIFVSIAGYELLYKVSNLGRIMSQQKTKGAGGNQIIPAKIVKPRLDKAGYEYFNLCKEGVKKKRYIHRLVAQHFIPNPEFKKEVNHKDGDKSNNHVDNLEWCTRLENEKHAWHTGLKSMKGANHFNSCPIIQMTIEDQVVGRFINGTDMETRTGLNRSVVQRCCRGKIKTAYGYKWKYCNVNN